jgi:hypothetical protein
MRGIRQVTVARVPNVRGRDLRKQCPVHLGINDAAKNDTSAYVPRNRNQFKGDTAVGAPITPGWAKKYGRLSA